ncbi:hypothetical protein T4D_7657 [Trichinella pseudospiralis]|uniref:Uncharacterized protein n=1 Tax=Trichinella pseudospiralis TaxID=6337 RepID=A0A0V1FM25_TRIPS|nr:hypothetical protein T4D_7657 [Trichinella pseudospiralis]
MALTPHYFYPPYGISIKTTVLLVLILTALRSIHNKLKIGIVFIALRNFQCSCHLLFVTYPYALTHLPLSPFLVSFVS